VEAEAEAGEAAAGAEEAAAEEEEAAEAAAAADGVAAWSAVRTPCLITTNVSKPSAAVIA